MQQYCDCSSTSGTQRVQSFVLDAIATTFTASPHDPRIACPFSSYQPANIEEGIFARPDFMNTRLIIKNVPKHIKDSDFRAHFAKFGTITDSKIMRRPDGHSRQFGFIGYSSNEEADRARRHFDKTFIDTSRIEVQFASKVGDESMAHSRTHNSRISSTKPFSSESQSAKPKNQLSQDLDLLNKLKSGVDPELKAFASSLRSRSQTQVWANDDVAFEHSGPLSAPAAEHLEKLVFNDDGASSSDEYEDMKEEADFVKSNPDAAALSALAASVTNVDRTSLAFDSKIDNMQYLKSKFATLDDEVLDTTSSSSRKPSKSKKVNVASCDDSVFISAKANTKSSAKSSKKHRKAECEPVDVDVGHEIHDDENVVCHDDVQEESNESVDATSELNPHDIIRESGRLFLRNCSFSMSEVDLRSAFSVFGDVVDAHICIDKRTKKSTGMAFVTFLMPRDAVKAFDALNGTPLCGRILHILPAVAAQTADKDTSHLSYKEKKALKEKAEAENGHNWNALFMKNDAVAAAVSARLGIEKTEFLDHEVSSSLAVRMALGETHVVSETKTQLLQDGVNVSVLENANKKTPRSNSVILIKNISHECNAEELRRLFSKHGDIVRVVLPATRTIALIEFHHPNEAKTAFRSLAYTRLYDTPLFLEWAPDGIFEGPPAPAAVSQSLPSSAPNAAMLPSAQSGGTVFVKNLSFSTSSERLRQHCENLGIPSKAASIVAHKGGEKNGLSRGYGFVEFDSVATASKMLVKLHGSKLDGHALEAKLSTRASASFDEPGLISSSASMQSQANTKLVLKNVPFEATKKELYELFKPFGQLKTLRLPRKFDGNHRGFAFVDFLTAGEAENALKVLKHTHFYGRHLVIAPAKDDESLETLRLKTAKHFDALRDGTKTKRSRVEEALEEEDTGSSDLDE